MKAALALVVIGIGTLGVSALPTVARADVFAAFDAPDASRTNTDIRLVNTATDRFVALPAGVNTSADELHPSVTADGDRMVFQRVTPGGVSRIIMVDLGTGRQADLFDAFETAAIGPNDPSITPNGTSVLTGRRAASIYATELVDVRSFPSEPFRKTTLQDRSGMLGGVTSLNANLTDAGVRAYVGAQEDAIFYVGPSAPAPVLGFPTSGCCFVRPSLARERGGRVGHPSINPAQPRFVVYDDFRLGTSGPLAGDLRVLDVGTGRDLLQARSLALPGVNTSVSDESRAGFTPDGRYVGFLRHRASSTQLLVWDSQSQQFLSGVSIGAVDQRSGPGLRARLRGNVSLFQRLRFATFGATSGGLISGRLLTGSDVGIVVHRVVGFRRLLGRRVPRLRLIGRVPLGHHDRGRLRIRWDRRVNGRRLRPGLYQVTPRIVTRRGRVRDLGKPALVRVRVRRR